VANGGGSVATDATGRTEHSWGGAAYQQHAVAAYWSAKRGMAFRKRLAKDVADSKKRSRAAKAAWKRRKAVAHA
jgi:hypothetical protein